MIENAYSEVTQQFALVSAAPTIAAGGIIVCVTTTWTVCHWLYRNKLASRDDAIVSLRAALEQKNSTIEAYKLRLDGASPDDAKKKMELLEDSVAGLKQELQSLGQTDLVAHFEKELATRPSDDGEF